MTSSESMSSQESDNRSEDLPAALEIGARYCFKHGWNRVCVPYNDSGLAARVVEKVYSEEGCNVSVTYDALRLSPVAALSDLFSGPGSLVAVVLCVSGPVGRLSSSTTRLWSKSVSSDLREWVESGISPVLAASACCMSKLIYGGCLALIVPGRELIGHHASVFWRWSSSNYLIEFVIRVGQLAVVLMKNAKPGKTKLVSSSQISSLLRWAKNGFGARSKGVKFEPWILRPSERVLVGDWFVVKTGLSVPFRKFFCLTSSKIKKYALDSQFFVRFLKDSRYVRGCSSFDLGILDEMDKSGVPTFLFVAPDGADYDDFPKSVKNYIKNGILAGLGSKRKSAKEKLWCVSSDHSPAPFVCIRSCSRRDRILENKSMVWVSDSFLCMYPKRELSSTSEFVSDLNRNTDWSQIGWKTGSGVIVLDVGSLSRTPV